jgi:hypothetical protein
MPNITNVAIIIFRVDDFVEIANITIFANSKIAAIVKQIRAIRQAGGDILMPPHPNPIKMGTRTKMPVQLNIQSRTMPSII